MMEVQKIIDKNKEAAIIPDGIAVIGRDMNIIVFNDAASRITGYGVDELVGYDASILFKNKPEDLNYIKDSITFNRVYTNIALDVTDKKGNIKNVLTSITPIIKDNLVLSAIFIFRDTREMLALSDELEKRTGELIDQKNKLDAVFESNIEGTFTIDEKWNVTSFNKSAEKITGYSRHEAVGKKCWDIFNSNICRNGCHMECTMNEGKPMVGNELEIMRKDGRRVPIRVNSAVLLNNKMENIGAVETFIDTSEIKNLSAHLSEMYKFENIIGRNREIGRIFAVLENVSQTDSSVLITGESGTGKELAARAIHLNSSRSKMPFVAVNCSAFVESLIESELFGHEKGSFTGAIKTKIGKFELAQGGTLFIDEIGDLTPAVQTKLLRVLEMKEFERVGGNKTIKLNARIIAATNKDLNHEILEGRFREDLYYRINIVNIHMPPLRERMDDIPLFINHFIELFNSKFNRKVKRFSNAAFDILCEYNWPGNIRELENVVEHCFVMCSSENIDVECLPKKFREREFLSGSKNISGSILENAERELILSVLEKNNRSRIKASKELNINPSTLWRKMKKYGINI